MCGFIQYCFLCMCGVVSAAFGYNPSGLTLKSCIVGVLTLIILVCVVLGIMWLFTIIRIRIKRYK